MKGVSRFQAKEHVAWLKPWLVLPDLTYCGCCFAAPAALGKLGEAEDAAGYFDLYVEVDNTDLAAVEGQQDPDEDCADLPTGFSCSLCDDGGEADL